MRSENINELIGALACAQGKMSGAAKDCSNPFFKSKYADLNSIWNACREALSENGLAVVQTVQQTEGETILLTTLGHKSGQWMSSAMPIKVKGDGRTNELQVLGSCITYLRRYSLAAIVGVAPDEDDDGNSGQNYKAPANKEQPKEPSVAQIPAISTAQANEIRSLIALCDADFTAKIMGYLSNNGMPNIDRMLVSFFEPIKKRIQKYLSDEVSTEKANDG